MLIPNTSVGALKKLQTKTTDRDLPITFESRLGAFKENLDISRRKILSSAEYFFLIL